MTDKPHRNRLHRLVLATLGCLCAVGNLSAQPYSAGLEDANNPHDAPVPGFADDGSQVNPLFLAWADSVADYSPVTDAEGNPVVDPFGNTPAKRSVRSPGTTLRLSRWATSAALPFRPGGARAR